MPLLAIVLSARADGFNNPFVITVVDEQTGRGVPLVELTTVNQVRFVTDSAGRIALIEPGFFHQKIYFTISSHGYEYPKDGFGFRGARLDITPGGSATLKIKRLNIAQRIYRVTGEGIYQDTILAGQTAPIAQPLLNGKVFGQDSVQRAIYRGKIRWFWGDTARPWYPLGHFGTAGAVSELPGHGRLDPAVGINLTYFVDPEGFSRPMVPGNNLRWIDGVVVLNDDQGQPRLLAKCSVRKDLSTELSRKLLIYNDDKDVFDDLKQLEPEEPLCPSGHPFTHAGYFYFPSPLPHLRVKADFKSIQTPSAYEGFTCLAPGIRFAKSNSKLDRHSGGKLIWSWKANTPPLSVTEQNELVKSGLIREDEVRTRIRDPRTNQVILPHGGSVAWNDHRKKWIMIFVQFMAKESMLGEVWYSESDQLEGPWNRAVKIVTHDRYSFYNPVHHPFYDQQGGRIIYFEGTYASTFSRQHDLTPRYEYNQMMYRLDLADERLQLTRLDGQTAK